MITALRTKLPLDVWLCGLLIAVSGLVFFAEGVIRYATEGGANIMIIPGIIGGLEVLAAVGVLAAVRFARPAALTFLGVGALLQLLIVVGQGPAWTRIVAGVLVAAQLYAIVLLHTGPVRDHCGLVR